MPVPRPEYPPGKRRMRRRLSRGQAGRARWGFYNKPVQLFTISFLLRALRACGGCLPWPKVPPLLPLFNPILF